MGPRGHDPVNQPCHDGALADAMAAAPGNTQGDDRIDTIEASLLDLCTDILQQSPLPLVRTVEVFQDSRLTPRIGEQDIA